MSLNNPEEVERIMAMRRRNQPTPAPTPTPAPRSRPTPATTSPKVPALKLAVDKAPAPEKPAKLPPPDRSGLIGELRHPRIASLVTGWMEISPERALHYLDYNRHNRKVNKNKITSFARQHAAGDFVDTHQGVAFNDADELADGQHTLKMIVLTGKPLLRMVTFGLPKNPEGKAFTTMDVIDAGGRSVADQLTISHGVKDSAAVKQVCGALANLCYGGRTRLLSVGQMLEIFNAFKPSVEFVLGHRSKQTGLKQAGVLAGFAFAHAAMLPNAAAIEKWFGDLNRGDDLIVEDEYLEARKEGRAVRPLEHLRWFLLSEESALFSKSMNRAIAHVTLQVLYGEQHKAKTDALEQSEVGTNWYAAKQAERVAKIAGLFALPKDQTPAVPKSDLSKPMPGLGVVTPPAAAPAAAPVKAERSSLDKILTAVEAQSKLSKFILTGRGSDSDIEAARALFVCVAASYGHTVEAIAAVIKRGTGWTKEAVIPTNAMTSKQRTAFEALKTRLTKV